MRYFASMLAAAALALGVQPLAAQDGPQFAVLDPRGSLPEVEPAPLAPRLDSLQGKRIRIVKSWPGNSGFDDTIEPIAQSLRARGAEVTVSDRNTSYSQDDPQLWADMRETADAFVYVAAASSSTTAYAFRWSAQLERGGMPGVVVNFDELATVGDLSNARFAVPVRRVEFDYPPEAMEPGALEQAIADVAQALLRPLTRAEIRPVAAPREDRSGILLTGTLQEVQDRFYEMGLTDGLPIVPPTQAAVDAMLRGTSHDPDEVVATEFPPEGMIATVRQVAINGVMAGCSAEHLPVLLATIEAFQVNNMNSILRSTNAFSFMQVVNGPIRQELEMNAASNAIGPGNRPNACMGRALRLFVTNLGDGHFGVNLMAVIGNNSNYAFLFAENEEMSPWPSLAEDAGFASTDNTLTLFVGGWGHAGNYGLGTEISDVPPDLAAFQIAGGATLIVSPARAEALAAEGMTKEALEDYLEQTACRTLEDLRKEGRFQSVAGYEDQPGDTCIPRFAEGTITVVVAGNDASPMMQAWSMYRPVTVSIDKWR